MDAQRDFARLDRQQTAEQAKYEWAVGERDERSRRKMTNMVMAFLFLIGLPTMIIFVANAVGIW